jgi:hypothetical protein
MFNGRRFRYPRRLVGQAGAAAGGDAAAKKPRGVPLRAKGDKVGDVKTLRGEAFRLTKITTKAGKEMFRWKKVTPPRKSSASAKSKSSKGSSKTTRSSSASSASKKKKTASSAPSKKKTASSASSSSSAKSRSKSTSRSGSAQQAFGSERSLGLLLSAPRHSPRRGGAAGAAGAAAAARGSYSALASRLRRLRGSAGRGGGAPQKDVILPTSCLTFVVKKSCVKQMCRK